MCSSLLQWSLDLYQAEKRITGVKLGKFTKLTTILTQNDNFDLPWQFLIHSSLHNSYSQTLVILFSVLDKSRDPGANWSKLEPHVGHLSALSLLRQFTIDEKHIEERDNQIIFNDLSWNKDSLTNFMISSSKAG